MLQGEEVLRLALLCQALPQMLLLKLWDLEGFFPGSCVPSHTHHLLQ